MKSNGTLVKLAGSSDTHRAALAAAVPADYEIKPLFTVAPPPPLQQAASRRGGANADAYMGLGAASDQR